MTYQYKKEPFAYGQKGNIKLSLAVIFGLFLLCVIYLAQINGAVAKNFALRSAQNSLRQTREANQQLTVRLMNVQSLANLEEAAKKFNLVSIEETGYLKIAPGGFVAFSQGY